MTARIRSRFCMVLCRNHPIHRLESRGYTLIEFLIVVIILGVLSVLALFTLASFLRRERVNAVALGLYGWLNEVRQVSLRLQNEGSNEGRSCTVQFGYSALPGGRQQIASIPDLTTSSIDNTACREILGSRSAFVLEPSDTGGLSVSISTSPVSSLTYTPRGLTTNAQDVILGIVIGSRDPQRCVKIYANSGFLQIGRNDTSSIPSALCTFSPIRGF